MSKRLPFHVPEDNGPPIWRSLAEKAQPELRAQRADVEDAVLVPEKSVLNRRQFMAVTGATAAAVSLSGCLRRPAENILPYSRAPEYSLPGIPLHFATTVSHNGEAVGLIVESHEGRPTKIEGNPDHAGSRGGTDAQIQAMVVDLYDPARLPHPMRREGEDRERATWSDFFEWWSEKQGRLAGGQGLAILSPPIDSPSMIRVRQHLGQSMPQARWHTWTPVSNSNVREGQRLAMNDPASAIFDFARAKVVLSLDCDFLGSESGSIRNARLFAGTRRLNGPSDEMSRLYSVEGVLSITGMNADHRLRLAPSRIDAYLRALATRFRSGQRGLPPDIQAALGSPEIDVPAEWLDAVAADLMANVGRAVIVVGRGQPPHVHALAHALNLLVLGAVGPIVQLRDAVDREEPDHARSLGELVGAMRDGQVDTLFILGGNPVYDAPADLEFEAALERVPSSVHLSLFDDETSQKCTWHLNEAHWLESWGDHQAVDGVVSIQQPLIGTLRGGHSALEVLAKIAGLRQWRGYHIVRGTVREATGTAFERAWRSSLHSGVTPLRLGSQRPPGLRVPELTQRLTEQRPAANEGWEAVFIPSYQTLDGRFANNPWMLELPDPVTKIVWDNAAYLSPASARELAVENGDLIRIRHEHGEITIPAYILPGQADRVVGLPLGFGRTHAGPHGNGVGVNVYPLRQADALGFVAIEEPSKVGGSHEIVVTQEHHSMAGRPLAVEATLDEYRGTPDFPGWASATVIANARALDANAPITDYERPGTPTPEVSPLWTQVDYGAPREPAQGGLTYAPWPEQRPAREGAPPRYKWGFVVDLATCTGCSACVIACQAENNIAVVGKMQVARGREMHWMRLDRYFIGHDENNPRAAIQPMFCQHCEEAPCENVCPVNATAHSPEGLNDMAYNRCIGTRYCMNNCPYKVRRFNFLDFRGRVDELVSMQHNPNVTVRMRGVMEKCSYCVQRLQAARIRARTETTVDAQGEIHERRIRPEEVTPACAQACPSNALVFGDLNEEGSDVKRASEMDRAYQVLAAIGTQPRTRYLGRIRNPNAAMTPDPENA